MTAARTVSVDPVKLYNELYEVSSMGLKGYTGRYTSVNGMITRVNDFITNNKFRVVLESLTPMLQGLYGDVLERHGILESHETPKRVREPISPMRSRTVPKEETLEGTLSAMEVMWEIEGKIASGELWRLGAKKYLLKNHKYLHPDHGGNTEDWLIISSLYMR